jgi:methylated-DNA-protein-cysteine methyltransferase related protein
MLNITEYQAETIGFYQAVIRITKQIPSGKVLGYGHLATLIGKPRNPRQVGSVLKKISPTDNIPWWRVIRSDGSIAMQGDITRGPLQIQRLKAEQVTFRGHRVDMIISRWEPEIT